MANKSEFAVVICHGSYHSPAPYMPFVEALKASGIDAYCPQLPTADLAKLNVGDDVANPNYDLGPPAAGYPQGEEDVAAIMEILGPLVEEQGKKVLMLGHSSGGWAATEAAQPHLHAKNRDKQGLPGGIIGIIYVGAFVIPVGESVNSFFQPKDGNFVVPPFMKFHKHGATGLGTMVEPEKYLFSDLKGSVEEARKWTKTLTASPILTTKLSNEAAYAALPLAYVVLENDTTLAKEYQEGMVALQAAKTGAFTKYYSPSGHSPHLSWTDGLVETVHDFVAKIEEGR
ncbi:Alpha/beta hydrolase fold-1 [Xylariaceae sp. FL0594]|nr:Alpha/beta hydrolase fold-1 [Xylariaceae sp. FL0594]